jgi:hypothetical protein
VFIVLAAKQLYSQQASCIRSISSKAVVFAAFAALAAKQLYSQQDSCIRSICSISSKAVVLAARQLYSQHLQH